LHLDGAQQEELHRDIKEDLFILLFEPKYEPEEGRSLGQMLAELSALWPVPPAAGCAAAPATNPRRDWLAAGDANCGGRAFPREPPGSLPGLRATERLAKRNFSVPLPSQPCSA